MKAALISEVPRPLRPKLRSGERVKRGRDTLSVGLIL